ncbi:TonB-dependent hemoglobin/transferrin/lactoferrin family receptor [Magnetospirillum sulfuroxidans]|uniref:TonB-dependent hemoglobin/transferrin/lactoferrin family receptor n=1 Tax=Magnetospirillum sulfuroxidans TaxID=611300 RepID=A0ABS5IBF4_9PROT|nr:TonB-dependent hemoglobin/transferrin/lactoferrin family receptor [Magnetospirillum sulfuroxidans]MBR9971472.1 TonB-dependent hemoglobin/transferrin/lactoferrin family receptor [Magnetospirillum sulfuroxidans]
MPASRLLLPSALIVSAAMAATAARAADPADPATRLHGVSVTTTRTEKPVDETPAAVTVIGPEELERKAPQDLRDILRDVPGVSFSGGPRAGVMSPTIRGLGDERVVIRIDNARQNYQVGHKARLFVEPDLLKQVEVLRGPSSTMFGSGAIGGVINMTTKDAADLLKPGQLAGAMTRYSYASNPNENHVTGTAYARPVEWLDLLASVSHRNYGNLEDGQETKLVDSGDNLVSGLFKVSVTPAPHHKVTAQAERNISNTTIPLTADSSSNGAAANTADRDLVRNSYALHYVYDDPTDRMFNLRATLYRNETELDDYRASDRRHDERDQTTEGFDIANTSRFAGLGSNHALTYGVEGYEDRQEGKRDNVSTPGWYPDATMDIFGGFIQDEIGFGPLTVTPGIRYDSFDLSATGQRERSDSAVSPRLAVAYQATPWAQPYVSYAQAFRAPSLTTMFNSGQHYPGNNFIANPDLKPEKAQNFELGANLKWHDVLAKDKLTGKLAAYHNNVEDFIEQTIGGTTTTTRNISKARIRGVEAELGYESLSWFGSLGAAMIRGKNVTDNTSINSIPADQVSLTIGHRFSEWGVETGWRAALVDSQDRIVNGSGTATGGYALHDLFASWTPPQLNDDVRLDFAVDNIFDKSYRPHDSALREAGRNVKAGVTVKF